MHQKTKNTATNQEILAPNLQRNSKLCCCHNKAQKTQDDCWFYGKQIQEMHQRTLPEAVVYQGHVDKRGVQPRHGYLETRILLIYTVPSPKKKLN